MGHLLIILGETPFHSDKTEQAFTIAETAVRLCHDLSFFLFMDGVYNVINSQNGQPFKVTPNSRRLERLLEDGARIFCCKLCTMLRGITPSLIPEGIEVSGVAELNDLVAFSDAVLSFTR
jgi:sulfur relay (sulfurtransferase) complex TusBCD TusD component (DsrE family)